MSGAGDLTGGLEDGPDLHLVDLGIGDAEATAPMAQHRVGFVKLADPPPELIGVQAPGLGHGADVLLGLGQELMQGRIKEPDGDRQPLHDGEDLDEVGLLHGQDLRQGRAPAGFVVRQDHLADGLDALVVEEHVLGPAQADALGAELARGARVQRGLRIGPDLQAPEAVGPSHEGGEVAGQLGLDHLDRAGQHIPAAAIHRDDLARPDAPAANMEDTGLLVDPDIPGARDAGPPHAAGDHGGVAGHAAARRDNAAGRMHAVDVLGAGLLADEDHRLAGAAPALGLVGVEDDHARGRPRRGRQAGREEVAGAGGVDGGVQELVEAGRIDPHDRFLPADQALGGHVDRHLQGGLGGALPVAGLQHVEPALLDRELHVLHVAVVPLEPLHHRPELGEDLREGLLHRGRPVAHLLARGAGQGLGGADSRHHVLALGVDQELPVKPVLPRGRVAGEGHPRRRGVAHVAEHHGLDVDGRAPALRDVVHAPVELGALVHPAGEDGADRAPELGLGILGEGLAQLFLNGGLVVGDDLFPVRGGQGGVDGDVEPVLVVVEDLLEQVMVQAQHHVRVHLDEAPVGIEGEATVAGEGGEALGRRIVEAQVQDGVHHAGHGGPATRADRDQEGRRRIPEPLAGQGLDARQGRLDLGFKVLRVGPVVCVEVVAGLGRDGEAGGDRQTEGRHLRQVGALAAQEVAHGGVPLGLPAPEGVDPTRLTGHAPSPIR